MFSNYLKIALRSLNKNKLHTLINVTGLSLGVASVFLISLYIQYETRYDTYYDQYENLYRITWEDESPQTRTPHPMAQALAEDFPEVESAVTLSPLWAAGLTREIFSIRNLQKDIKFDEYNVLAVDSTFFDVFRFPVTRGDAHQALKSTNGILISESTAKKYFGDEDPIGKQLAVNSDTVLLDVMAVFKDVPAQSHFHFDFLVSYVREKSLDPDSEYYTWKDFGHYNYIRLKPGANAKALEAKIMPWMRKYIDISDEDYRSALTNNMGFRVQPVTDIHLKSHLRWELEPNGNIEYVYTMTGAALLTLLIACINFMNLMTAKSTERAKEIGIRKTLGALRQQLSFQFLGESVLITMISIVIGALIVEGSLPFYNIVTGQSLILDYAVALPILIALGLIIGIGAGFYPSLFLSSIKPHLILKGKFQTSNRGNGLRNGLIVFQFAISMALISAAAIIFNQLKFIQEKNLGFNKEEVLVVPLKNSVLSRRMDALKTELLKVEGVTSVSASSNLPGGQFNQNPVTVVQFPDNDINFSETLVDYDFLKTMNIELTDGRFFLPENRADSALSFVINETGAKQLFLDQPIGKELHWEAYGRGLNGKIIGMVKDFHFQSLHEPVRPLLFVFYPAYNHLVIKLKPKNFDAAVSQIKNIYAQFDNSFAFEFSFLDERLNKQYQAEQRTGIIFGAFAFIAIGIACFGLFGMAMLTFSQRMKEVSIRKVLGASVSGLIVFLLRDFTRLIIIAIILATPLAWWGMDLWLDNFIYQVGIHPVVFILSGLALLVISWATLSYFTLKTSRLNPAETLKNE
jgi:putative ABC transport system permease protein